ncbi:prepilin peptidase, partial [Candidatus Gracilibacteria bacterium]|nr:prepilin peptidase [Candidatus Gracilibacteria bacterium]
MFFPILISFCIGLIFGSFSTVLIERWHSGRGGIMMGRSECPHCKHILHTRDLFPLFSYIMSGRQCRYCGINIPLFYPFAEVLMGIIFAILTYSAMIIGIDILSIEMLLLLGFGFITGVYTLYDLRYMEIPDQIMVPAIYFLFAIPFFSLLFTGYSEYTFHTFHISIFDRLLGALILYTFFYIQILIPGGYFLIK